MPSGHRPNARQAGAEPAPLSVLLITQGAERDRLLNGLIDHTNSDAVRYAIVSLLGGDGPLLADMATRRVEVRSLGLADGSLESVPLALVRLRRVLRAARPDVIHSVSFYGSLTSELARTTCPGAPPSLLVRHHNAVHHMSGRRLHVGLDRWMACRATQVAAVSRTVARTLSEAERVPAEHVTVIRNGLDWERTVRVDAAACARWRARFEGRRLLVAAGRLKAVKDYPTMLRMLVRVVQRYPDVVLVIAGTGTSEERVRLEQLAGSMGLDRAVEFLGWIPDVYDLMAAADVFVQSSIDEAFSQTILEARGLGVPVAVTTVGAVREVVSEDHETITAGDDDHLAQRVGLLLAAPDAARAGAAAAVRSTRERFSARAMTDAYVALYKRLAGFPVRVHAASAGR